MQAEDLHTGKRLQSDRSLVGDTFLIKILGDAPAGISAHHSFRTVGIEDAHRVVGFLLILRFANEHQSIAANARMRLAPCDGCCV